MIQAGDLEDLLARAPQGGRLHPVLLALRDEIAWFDRMESEAEKSDRLQAKRVRQQILPAILGLVGKIRKALEAGVGEERLEAHIDALERGAALLALTRTRVQERILEEGEISAQVLDDYAKRVGDLSDELPPIEAPLTDERPSSVPPVRPSPPRPPLIGRRVAAGVALVVAAFSLLIFGPRAPRLLLVAYPMVALGLYLCLSRPPSNGGLPDR